VTRGELLFTAEQFDRAPLCQRDVRRVVRCDVRAQLRDPLQQWPVRHPTHWCVDGRTDV